MKPKIKIRPVKIGGVKITYATAHNAKFISYLVLDYIYAIFYSRFLIIKDHFNRNCMSTHFRAVL